MWLIANFGFFSAVERRPGTVPAGDNRTLQIRARSKDHLDKLRDTYMGDTLGPTVTGDDDPQFKNSDYAFRAYCTPDAFGRAAYAVAMDIDYTNFKSSVKDTELHNAYMAVWTALYQGLGGYHNTFKSYDTSVRWWEDLEGKGSGYAAHSGTSVGHQGKYASIFGDVEDPDADDDMRSPMYRWSRSSASLADKPYDGLHNFSDDEDPEHNLEALLSRYTPFVPPENTPNILTRADVVEWLGSSSALFRRFLAGNLRWRSYKNGSQNRYQFPKSVMGELEEHYNIWLSERLEDQ